MNLETVVADMIQQYGEPVTLRRITGGIKFDVTVVAVVRGYQPNELVGGIVQGDRLVIISNREIGRRQWPGPPKIGDQFIIRGKTATVQGVSTIVVEDTTVKHTLQIRGS